MTINNELFNQMIVRKFDEWLVKLCNNPEWTGPSDNPEFLKQHFPNVIKDLKSAFKGGWLACEEHFLKEK